MKDLALFLSRKKGDYSHGIPAAKRETSVGRMLFVFKGDTAENRDFLTAIVEKGYKLKANEQEFFAIDSNEGEITSVSDDNGSPWRMIVVFGENIAKKFSPSNSQLITAPDIEIVRGNQEVKKQLWSRIKDL
jgi:hypothetical protein